MEFRPAENQLIRIVPINHEGGVWRVEPVWVEPVGSRHVGLKVLDPPKAVVQSGRAPTSQEAEKMRLAEAPPEPTLEELVRPARQAKPKAPA